MPEEEEQKTKRFFFIFQEYRNRNCVLGAESAVVSLSIVLDMRGKKRSIFFYPSLSFKYWTSECAQRDACECIFAMCGGQKWVSGQHKLQFWWWWWRRRHHKWLSLFEITRENGHHQQVHTSCGYIHSMSLDNIIGFCGTQKFDLWPQNFAAYRCQKEQRAIATTARNVHREWQSERARQPIQQLFRF